MFSFESMIAWRFLKESRSQTILILLGIIIGVSVQIFLSSLISGLQRNLIEQTVGDSPHILLKAQENSPQSILQKGNQSLVIPIITAAKKDAYILSYQPLLKKLDTFPNLKIVSSLVEGSGFITKAEVSRPVVVKGIFLDRADGIYKIIQRVNNGKAVLGGTGVLIGRGLAEDLKIETGSIIEIRTSEGNSGAFAVNGIFDFENAAINSSWIFMDIFRSQALFDLNGAISRIEMQIDQVFQSENIAQKIKKDNPDFLIETWQSNNRQLLSALQSQSASSYMIQFFVLLAVTLGIASVLAIAAVQKSREIGILKAMGTRTNSASRIFLIQGAVLGLSGSILGSLVGVGLIKMFQIASQSGGALSFSIQVEFRTAISLIVISTIASIGAALFPARKAASLVPIEVIRNG
ncbi:MAG TPA: ABC transporter permease [Atribacter sp.]|uniref:ABC transporter permease n=1 Tax=Atribacter sp. TaxID=2847780 RepID=UPI002CCAA7B8|nr:FtsX-like permease family protein [Atribacter sp.]HQK83153.1 ABC transporter permease [Atribacter sp.]